MEVVTTLVDMIAARDRAIRPLGLVPTMGYLHDGHLSLVKRARLENRTLVVSIFVNPAQFGPNEDLDSYPRDIDRDLRLLKKHDVDLVFACDVSEMYPPGYQTYVDLELLTGKLDGRYRPSHFQGVATIVTKLFTIIRPDKSYFGQKDGQQAVIIKRLNRDLNLGAEIVVSPTVREADGLAMSSRNVYLTKAERKAAPIIYKALCIGRSIWEQGIRDAKFLEREMASVIAGEPLAKLEYVSIVDINTLEELENVDRLAMVCVAVKFGKARLIDNIVLGEEYLE